jgi:hypothetical protein
MIIGGVAVIARGVRRLTTDIDAAIRGDEIEIDALITALAAKRIVPRNTNPALFARQNLVLLVKHEPTGVDLDLSFAWTSFEQEAIAAATSAKFGVEKAPMALAKDLVVFKAYAGRGKDLDDVVALLTLYPRIDLSYARSHVRDLAELADRPEAVRNLEEAVVKAARLKKAPKRSGAPKGKK